MFSTAKLFKRDFRLLTKLFTTQQTNTLYTYSFKYKNVLLELQKLNNFQKLAHLFLK